MLDLMKLDIERRSAPVDISRLPLAAIEDPPGGGLRIGAQASNSDLAAAALRPAVQRARISTHRPRADERPVLPPMVGPELFRRCNRGRLNA